MEASSGGSSPTGLSAVPPAQQPDALSASLPSGTIRVESLSLQRPSPEASTAARFRVGVQNIHLASRTTRQSFVNTVKESKLFVCGVVESWLKGSSNIMDAELFGSDWVWLGKDRMKRKGGGLGFLAKKSLKPRLPKPGKESILWLEVEFCGKWYLGLIYLVPSAVIASKMAILSELRQGIVEFSGKGKVLVLGDFNARMGDLPNSLNLLSGSQVPLLVARTSRDQKVSSLGRKVMASLNEAGLVLLNGVGEMAEFTTLGDTVIDLIWAQSGDLNAFEQLSVMEDEDGVSDHHFLVTATFKLADTDVRPQPVRAEHQQVRWNVKSRGNPAHWLNLQKVGDQLMAGWTPPKIVHGNTRAGAESTWDCWLDSI